MTPPAGPQGQPWRAYQGASGYIVETDDRQPRTQKRQTLQCHSMAQAELIADSVNARAHAAAVEKALKRLVAQVKRSVDGATEPNEYQGDEIQVILGSDAWKAALASIPQTPTTK